MNVLVAISPIVLLIYLMTRKKSVASYIALPIAAVLLYAVKLFYFHSDLTLVNAAVISGLLTAWTPILVIWGAIFLFRTMEHSGGLTTIRQWLNGITTNSIGQLMIIGWAFAFLIEGASGFGTPAALAAPLLVSLGFPPVRVAIMALIMNSVPVTFGAVGTPTWFGLGQLGLSHPDLLSIGFKSALIHSVAALIIPIIALRIMASWKEIRQNVIFIYLSIVSCVLPYLILSQFNYEFPSLIGGAIGLLLSVFFAKMNIGMSPSKKSVRQKFDLQVIKALFPLWGTILLLIITRIEQLGIKSWLTAQSPALKIGLQPFGDFVMSRSMVIQLNNILGTDLNFSHALLYIPSLLPFFVISFLTFWWYRSNKKTIRKAWSSSWKQIKKPIIALSAALIFVKLLSVGNDEALTILIGKGMADLSGGSWQYISPYLGALGAFFSGSNTVSNLTFAGIQKAIAIDLNLNLTTILAMQSVGGAMGNMVCINNIVAVCSVLGLKQKDGFILKRTVLPMILYGLIAAVIGLFLNF
ncbi:L-lactate permease [Candidatus Pacearchaeota archaeon]|nr:L-lactate permease [Candidatus Pacearchaeota archaeon]